MSSKTEGLTPERWARIEALFQAAVELPVADVDDYLAGHCADDERLAAEVRALLVAGANDVGQMENLIRDAATAAVEYADKPAQRLLGAYRVLSTLGHGGMGSVFLAERADEAYEQRVAIKLLHTGLVTPELKSRFRSERQILATLDHPNIARLIDGGTTGDGVPYLVMEYIDGVPVTDYCEDHALTLQSRLALFLQICAAVETAHRNLVVHRDIKPGNILVTADGTPKLLDFGIAKILGSARGLTRSDVTQLHERLLTPDNASPEQVLGETITTASDIYALGILLYRLLCSEPPYRLAGLKPAEYTQVITGTEPQPPSQLLADLAGNSGGESRRRAIAAARRLSPDKLARALRGDLDNIVLMALRKDPERRYRSVGQMADDIRRHQRGLPVIARADTWWYRSGKFLRRNKLGVALAASLLVFVSVVALVMALQATRIASERDTADAVAQLTVRLFEGADPLLNEEGANTPVSKVLDRGAAAVTAGLEARPRVRGRLRSSIGQAYLNLGEYDKAEQHFAAALADHEVVYGRRDERSIRNRHQLGLVQLGRADWTGAGRTFLEALELARGALGDKHVVVAMIREGLGRARLRAGDPEAGREQMLAAIAAVRTLGAEQEDLLATMLSGWANLLSETGDFIAMEAASREALAINRSIYGDKSATVANNLHGVALALFAQGRIEPSGPLFREALKINERVLGVAHRRTAFTKANYIRYLQAAGELDDAERLAAELVTTARTIFGVNHQWLAYAQVRLANIQADQGAHAEARETLRSAISVYAAAVGEQHSLYLEAQQLLGNVERELGHHDAALRELEAVQRELADGFAAGHWRRASADSDLAAVCLARGDDERALALLTGSARALAASLGPGHRLSEQAEGRLAEARARVSAP